MASKPTRRATKPKYEAKPKPRAKQPSVLKAHAVCPTSIANGTEKLTRYRNGSGFAPGAAQHLPNPVASFRPCGCEPGGNGSCALPPLPEDAPVLHANPVEESRAMVPAATATFPAYHRRVVDLLVAAQAAGEAPADAVNNLEEQDVRAGFVRDRTPEQVVALLLETYRHRAPGARR